MREKLKDNWLMILISVIIGIFIIPAFKLFFLNPNIKNSFDLGGFSGSIIGVLGAYGIAKWQFENSKRASMELEKEMFVRKKRIDMHYNILDDINMLYNVILDIEIDFRDGLFQKNLNGAEKIKKLQENLVEIRNRNQKIIEKSAIYLPLNKEENEYNIFFLFNDNRNNIFCCNQEIDSTKSKFGEKTDIEFINNLVDYRVGLNKYKSMLVALNACNIKEFTGLDVIDINQIKENFNKEIQNIEQNQKKEKININQES